MPIPKPGKKEDKETFISRCMGDEVMNKEYSDQKIRAGVCYTQWAEKDGKKMTKLADIKDLFTNDYTKIERIEILNQHPNAHKIQFTDDDFDEILANFNELKMSGELNPNVKLSHADQQLILKEYFKFKDVEFGEELPNLGYLTNLRKEGKSLFADIEQIPTVLSDIFNGLYSSLSPEILTDWRGEGGKVLRGIVLSNNPSQKHILDMHMSEALRYDGQPIFVKGGSTMGDT